MAEEDHVITWHWTWGRGEGDWYDASCKCGAFVLGLVSELDCEGWADDHVRQAVGLPADL